MLLASHVFLLTIVRRNLYSGYFVPTAYHNPTQQLNKLFALWMYFVYRSQFLSRPVSQPDVSDSGPGGTVRVVGAGEAVVPDRVRADGRAVRGARPHHPPLAAGASLPRWHRHPQRADSAVAELAWHRRWTTPVQVAFAPFVVFNARETLYKLPASLAFPLVVAGGAWMDADVGRGAVGSSGCSRRVALFVTLGSSKPASG